ncbi:MAG TPA: hypothetical protein VEU08_13520 [Vicinamibacterales bacterium]|nr:hypothetical protein [Vicinamibacterales bacterium]
MARAQLSQQKRARERAKQEKRQLKAERRQSAKTEKQNKSANPGEEDPDIAGIVPGPQPSPWEDVE